MDTNPVVDKLVGDVADWLYKAADAYTDGNDVEFEKLMDILKKVQTSVEFRESIWSY